MCQVFSERSDVGGVSGEVMILRLADSNFSSWLSKHMAISGRFPFADRKVVFLPFRIFVPDELVT
jgi:hypothetical protein